MARDGYKWDGDSRDERPSEFAYSGYSTLTRGEFLGTTTQERTLHERGAKPVHVRWSLLLAVCVVVLALYGIVAHMRW